MNDRIEEAIRDFCYISSEYPSFVQAIPVQNAYGRLLDVCLEGETFEIPLILMRVIINYPVYNRIVCPLNVNGTMSVGSAPTLFRYIGRELSAGLIQIDIKQETYYGCKGMIFDNQFNPLLFVNCLVRRQDNIISPLEIIFRVPSGIFNRLDEIIPKVIYKKIIPFVGTSGRFRVDFGTFAHYLPASVRIGQMENLLIRPAVPRPSTATPENITEIIRRGAMSL